jgi:hypothetical protein
MRTDWLDCGYGHIFEFTSSGQLSGVFEARRGTRNGAGVHVAEDGSVAKLLWFLDGKSVDRPAEEVPEVLRGVDTTDLVVRKTPLDGSAGLWRQDYMRKNGSQVASITFDGRGRVLTAVKIGSLGRACIPRWRSDKLNSLANVRFAVLGWSRALSQRNPRLEYDHVHQRMAVSVDLRLPARIARRADRTVMKCAAVS